MAVRGDPLPDDPVALKALLAAREVLISHLIEEITRLKRWRFGRSAETIDETICPQLPFQDPSGSASVTPPLTTDPDPVVSPEDSTVAGLEARRQRIKTRRTARALPAHLPRRTVVHAPDSCQCPECGSTLRRLGEDVSEMLD